MLDNFVADPIQSTRTQRVQTGAISGTGFKGLCESSMTHQNSSCQRKKDSMKMTLKERTGVTH